MNEWIKRVRKLYAKLKAPAWTPEEKNFRTLCLMEEVVEFSQAATPEDEIDALADLMVFAIGTAERMGHGGHVLDAAFHAVMNCNMRKEVGIKKGRNGPDGNDLIKPEGWTGPEDVIRQLVKDNLEYNGALADYGYKGLHNMGCGERVTDKAEQLSRLAGATEWVPEGAEEETAPPDGGQIWRTVTARQHKYGTFSDNARVIDAFQQTVNKVPGHVALSAEHRECVHAIFTKLARCLCGDPWHADNFHDIAGYALRMEEHIRAETEGDAPQLNFGGDV